MGELARLSGKTVRALHLYEEMGLLLPSGRSKGGFRLYPREAQQRVAWIGKLQDMRLSLTDIKELVEDWSQIRTAHRAMHRLRELVDKRLSQTEGQILRLTELRDEMRQSLDYLEKCRSCDVGRPTQCTTCDYDQAPMLIAQFHRPKTGEYPEVVSSGDDSG